jgi:hypothetical protein
VLVQFRKYTDKNEKEEFFSENFSLLIRKLFPTVREKYFYPTLEG